MSDTLLAKTARVELIFNVAIISTSSTIEQAIHCTTTRVRDLVGLGDVEEEYFIHIAPANAVEACVAADGSIVPATQRWLALPDREHLIFRHRKALPRGLKDRAIGF